MWVVFVEMGLALALAIFIVWFTWPKRRPPSTDEGEAERRDGDGSGGAGVK